MSSSLPSNFPEDNFSLADLHYHPIEYSYLYELFNITYHIKCEEIIIGGFPIINHGHQYDNVYHFDYKQPDTARVYHFTCRRLSPTFMSQFLNKYIYGVGFTKFENQEAFTVEYQDILRDHLIKDLTCYLEQNQFPTQNEILGLKFIEEYQNYTAISNTVTVVQLNGTSNENEKLEKETLRKCVWHEEPVKLLLSFLIKHKKEVNQLAAKRGGGGSIKTKLWDDAVAMLSENGYHEYNSKQCSIKWKNIKKDYNNNQSQYKSEVEEILNGNEVISTPGSLYYDDDDDIEVTAKRKMLDENTRSNKAAKFIFYGIPNH